MSACVSKSFHLSSPLKINEDNNIEKQGIITILGSDCQSSKAAASLRRTLSADMSSKKWLSENGFQTMKKIASSAQLSQEINSKGQDEIWASIQSNKDKEKNGAWGTIITQEQEDTSNLPPPYIHPLVKRSTSSLSEKSLEICTESLGTETGSDVFASYPTSEIGDQEDERYDGLKINPEPQVRHSLEDEIHVVKYNYSCSKKLPPKKTFPPPLPSLAQQDGASLQMQSHRVNGRLVLEAVSVPTNNYFHVQRQDGRLLLTLVDVKIGEMKDIVKEFDQVIDEVGREDEHILSHHHDVRIGEMKDIVKEFDQVFDDIDEVEREEKRISDDEEEEEDEENEEFMFEQSKKLPPSRVISMPKAAAFMMNKFMGLHKKNLTWSPTHVKLLGVDDEEEEIVVKNELTPLPQSLPSPPRVARLISSGAPPTASSFNAYEYFWREKQSVASIISPIHEDCNSTHLKNNHNKVILKSNLMGYDQQNLVLMKGDKGDYLVPFLNRCNEPRRSLLFWEPYCIATS